MVCAPRGYVYGYRDMIKIAWAGALSGPISPAALNVYLGMCTGTTSSYVLSHSTGTSSSAAKESG